MPRGSNDTTPARSAPPEPAVPAALPCGPCRRFGGDCRFCPTTAALLSALEETGT